VRAVFALPQGPSLRSGLCCPSPSSLNRPHPPHSWAHPDFAALRLIPDARAVRFPPRRPLSGSVLSLCLPSPHAALYDRGKFISCTRSVPSPMTLAFAKSLTARHSRNPHHPFPMGRWFRGFTGSLVRCGRVQLLAPLYGSDQEFPPANGDFYSRASGESVTLLVVGYNYAGN
jgi:hypothetical protein